MGGYEGLHRPRSPWNALVDLPIPKFWYDVLLFVRVVAQAETFSAMPEIMLAIC